MRGANHTTSWGLAGTQTAPYEGPGVRTAGPPATPPPSASSSAARRGPPLVTNLFLHLFSQKECPGVIADRLPAGLSRSLQGVTRRWSEGPFVDRVLGRLLGSSTTSCSSKRIVRGGFSKLRRSGWADPPLDTWALSRCPPALLEHAVLACREAPLSHVLGGTWGLVPNANLWADQDFLKGKL